MTTKQARKIFVNLAVEEIKRSMEFFAKLGFEFNPRFTDENAACMVVSDAAFVMLLAEPLFRTFTERALCDAHTHTEGLFAVSCESRAEVDSLLEKALAAGGTPAMPRQDHGFMLSTSFYDLDGHHWEVVWMDPSAVEKGAELS